MPRIFLFHLIWGYELYGRLSKSYYAINERKIASDEIAKLNDIAYGEYLKILRKDT